MEEEKTGMSIKEKFSIFMTNMKWVYRYARKNILYIVGFTCIGMTGTLVMLVSSLASRDMIDIITGRKYGDLIKTFAIIIGSQLLTLLINQISSLTSTYITTKVDNSIKADIYDSIMTSKWEYLDEYDSGFISARWAGDTSSVASGLLTLIPNICNGIFKFGTALIVVLRNDVSFAIFALVSVPLSYMVSKTNMYRLKNANRENMAISSKSSLFINESFINVQLIKAFDMISLYQDKLRFFQKESLKNRMKTSKVTSLNSALYTILTIAVTYSTMGWGIYQVWHGRITYGSMTLLIGMSSSLSTSIQNLVNIFPTLVNVTMATGRLMEIEDLPKDDYSNEPEVKEFVEKYKESGIGVRVEDATFLYKKGTKVFENASFEAYPSEIVGLVGPSGEGKTTLLRILLSVITTSKGEGYLFSYFNESDRVNITAAVRQAIAYVPQGNTLFAGTIAENMRNFKADASDEEIIDALKTACAWDFVSKMKDGINSELKERGGGLSEGQAQRISIARALLKNTPILLLDEATSALDMDTAGRVLKNIMSDKRPRTCIMTTHRPEVMDCCDRVFEISDGKMQQRIQQDREGN